MAGHGGTASGTGSAAPGSATGSGTAIECRSDSQGYCTQAGNRVRVCVCVCPTSHVTSRAHMPVCHKRITHTRTQIKELTENASTQT